MLESRRSVLVSLAVCLVLVLLPATAAQAAGVPATVKVRVEGFNGVTLLPETEVTTTTTPVPVEGGTCSGTSAGGALYDAVHGSWKAKLEPEGVEIDGIDGVDLPSFSEPSVYAYWSFWLNSEFAPEGACKEELSAGADVVFIGQCFAPGVECQKSATAPEHFLTMTAPAARVYSVGESVSVTVGSRNSGTGVPEASLPAGVAVSTEAPGVGTKSQSANPGPGGLTTLKLTTPGTYTLQARASDSSPSDSYEICVHNGNDGNCGTPAPLGGVQGPKVNFAPLPYRGAFALVPDVSAPLDGHFYAHGKGPRVLAGKILSHGSVTSVSLELRREYRGRCYAYEGARERFEKAACGTGKPFAVSKSEAFSYLLPSALPPGRYVLDIQATDAVGNHTTLARGTSRVVFHVR